MSRELILFICLLCIGLLGRPLKIHSARDVLVSGAASCEMPQVNGKAQLRLKALFATADDKRACWDFPVQVNLSSLAGIRLRTKWTNAHLTGEITIHVRLDDRWYGAKILPRQEGVWEELFIPKSAFVPENAQIASWRNCTKIRIAAWRGSNGAMQCQVDSIDFVPANVSMAVVRCVTQCRGKEKRLAENLRYAQWLVDTLNAGGIYPAVVDECDLMTSLLEDFRCVALPFAAEASQATVDQLVYYIENGGRLALFYEVPEKLRRAMRLPMGHYLAGRALPSPIVQLRSTGGATLKQRPQAIVATVDDEDASSRICAWWMNERGERTPYPALLRTPYGIWMSAIYQNADPVAGAVFLSAFLNDLVPSCRMAAMRELLRRTEFALQNTPKSHPRYAQAVRDYQKMRRGALEKDYPAAARCHQEILEALDCPADSTVSSAANSSTAPAFRGAWVRAVSRADAEGWGRMASKARTLTLNAMLPLMMTPYATGYPGKCLPYAARGSQCSDSLSVCIRQCHQRGLQVHAWCQLLGMADAPEETLRMFSRQGRLQIQLNGSVRPWLCPSDSRNISMLCKVLSEMCSVCPALDGINLDMLRLEGSTCCYCKNCTLAFKERLGGKLPDHWPSCTTRGQSHEIQWQQFRAEQIDKVLVAVVRAIRRANPKILISAAVYPDAANARTAVGQNWQRWCAANLVDWVMPMSYRAAAATFQEDIRRQKNSLGDRVAATKLMPGIGWSVIPLSATELQRQIQVVRNAGLPGYVLFELAEGH